MDLGQRIQNTWDHSPPAMVTIQRTHGFFLALEPALYQRHFLLNTVCVYVCVCARACVYVCVQIIFLTLNHQRVKRKGWEWGRETAVSNFLHNPLMRLEPS